eukprot:2936175-Prorocentrum_lima.AAC.1
MHLYSPESKVTWLGRPSDTIDHLGTWEEMSGKSIKERPMEELEDLELFELHSTENLWQVTPVA